METVAGSRWWGREVGGGTREGDRGAGAGGRVGKGWGVVDSVLFRVFSFPFSFVAILRPKFYVRRLVESKSSAVAVLSGGAVLR